MSREAGILGFREAGPGDIGVLRELASRIWWACYRGMIPDAQIAYMLDWMYAPERIASELARGVRWGLATDPAGIPVGFLAWEAEADTGRVQLHKLYLDPAWQGRGQGQRMLGHVAEAARRAGAREIRLRVNRRNERALRAYRRAGFEVVEDVRVDIGNGFVMDDHVLMLRLA